MSQLLALEWNGHEARVAVASRRGDHTIIEQAFSIPLPPASAEAGQAEPDIGQEIAASLAARGIGQLEALVAVGRGSVELRQLQLPPATDDELPMMVRLQALLEFNELDEKWLLDFIPVDAVGNGPRSVLAAAIAPASIERIQAVCRPSGLRIERVLLRSCAAAALLARPQFSLPGQVQLLVELFSGEADLTAAVDGKVLFLRTTRLRSNVAASKCLAGEIRLTMAAVQHQFGGRQVARIVLCGGGEADAATARQIERETGTSTVLADPFAAAELSPQLRASPPEQPGRFAAVLGMFVTEFERTGHAIDFLHPRRAVEPANPRTKWKLAAVAAGLLIVAYLAYGRLAYRRLEKEVRQLETRSAAADKILVASGNKTLASANEIAKWADGEIAWLDQLRDLSEDFPPAASATLSHLVLVESAERLPSSSSASAGVKMSGTMHLEGWASDGQAVTNMEQRLRAHARHVLGTRTSEDRSLPPYTLKFNTSALVGRGAKP
jgi:Tfp pilus assembly PilM family ATPase